MDNAAFIRPTPRRHACHATRRRMVRDNVLRFGMTSLAVLSLTQFRAAPQSYAQSVEPTMTSDTPEYCGVLMDRINLMTRTAAMPPPTEAATLSELGERMCGSGQARAGILRLRRALAIMRHAEQ